MNGDTSGHRHPVASIVVMLALIAATGTAVVLGADRTSAHRPGRIAESGGMITTPVLGVLGVTGTHFTGERAAGIDSVAITVGWGDSEPSPGTFNLTYLQSMEKEMTSARAAGLDVVLDPGLQYPPAWVFSLPGGTQFEDQYGDVFTGAGDSGNDVANAVTDPSVRSAEGTYLAWLGAHLPIGSVIAVRQGGGPLGELRYPGPDYDGHTNCYWAYDASSRATTPVPGWVPGTGTVAQAAAFLNNYNANLDSYGIWLNAQLKADFASTELVMLPGWGERPGGAAEEEASLLTLNMPEFNEGLDWTDLLDSLPDPTHSVAYTTYLDAATYLPTIQLEDPADYLASLVAGTSIKLGGENTGNGTFTTMRLCFQRAEALGFVIVEWMDEAQLEASTIGQDPDGPTFNLLGEGAAVWLTS